MADPYSILGVNRNASKDEIKKAYKKLAMKHHPDKGGNEAKFKEITDAYNQLTSDEPQMNGPGGFGFDPFDGMGMFSQMFGNSRFPFGNQNHRQTAKNEVKQIKKTISISMKEAYHGLNKTINITSDEKCTSCTTACDECDGSGVKMVHTKNQMGSACIIQSHMVNCTKCKNGVIIKDKNCTQCNSTGTIKINKNIEIKIEPGVQSNKTYSFSNIIKNTIISFIVNVERMPNYTIDNNHLIYYKDISFIDSIFGTRFSIEHPSGKNIEIDTTTNTNIILEKIPLTIQGKGMRQDKNLQVFFRITPPKAIDKNVSSEKLEEAKEILKSFLKD